MSKGNTILSSETKLGIHADFSFWFIFEKLAVLKVGFFYAHENDTLVNWLMFVYRSQPDEIGKEFLATQYNWSTYYREREREREREGERERVNTK